jgi:hypothetical protein
MLTRVECAITKITLLAARESMAPWRGGFGNYWNLFEELLMSKAHDGVIAKVASIFAELVGERASRLAGSTTGTEAERAIAAALKREHGAEVAKKIAFHLMDWNSDAAFLVALLLFPERFSAEETDAGVAMFLLHAPAHVLAAAKLGV